MTSHDDLQDYDETQHTTQKDLDIDTKVYFKDFSLKDELMRSITDVQFEHPSKVQQLCIPKAILGVDILCQAKSGTGKTAVFVLSTLQQVNPIEKETLVVTVVHTKELALQVKNEFLRFTKGLNITVDCFYGGQPLVDNINVLKDGQPNIVIGTPGRLLHLLNERFLKFNHVKHFVMDEVDELISDLSMRWDVQQIFTKTPVNKQTMMFTATMNKETQLDCLKFLRDPHVISVDEEKKLTLHGLLQNYMMVNESDKLARLEELIDNTDFTQLVIFVREKGRAGWLSRQLKNKGFPSVEIHAGMSVAERMSRFQRFKDVKERILVSTDLMARGIDVADVNVVINYDMPDTADTYLHRVGRAGRFETKGTAISFVESASDVTVLNDVQSRFEVNIKNLDE